MTDTFNGDTAHLIECIKALLEMNEAGALRPHGIGGHAASLLSSAAVRLAAPTRTEFEAAAYRYIRTAGFLSSGAPVITQAVYINGVFQNKHDLLVGEEADTAIAAAMGWPAVPEQGGRRLDVAIAERDHARALYERAVRLLTGIHAMLYPPRFTDNDGRTWQFKNPDDPHSQLQELSDRIRALPDEMEKLIAPPAPPAPEQEKKS